MKRSETFSKFAEAFAQFQAEVTNPKLTKDNPYYKSKYSPLDEVLNTVRPILSKYGLSVHQDVSTHDERPDHVVVVTTIYHKSGEYLESSPLVLPGFQKLKDGRMEFNAQGAGSSISYAKRYQLQAVCGIAAEEDMDGNEQVYPNQYTPQNMVATPSEATLKASYQVLKGSLDGYDDYIKKMRDEKGYDDKTILAKLKEGAKQKKQQEEQATG